MGSDKVVSLLAVKQLREAMAKYGINPEEIGKAFAATLRTSLVTPPEIVALLKQRELMERDREWAHLEALNEDFERDQEKQRVSDHPFCSWPEDDDRPLFEARCRFVLRKLWWGAEVCGKNLVQHASADEPVPRDHPSTAVGGWKRNARSEGRVARGSAAGPGIGSSSPTFGLPG